MSRTILALVVGMSMLSIGTNTFAARTGMGRLRVRVIEPHGRGARGAHVMIITSGRRHIGRAAGSAGPRGGFHTRVASGTYVVHAQGRDGGRGSARITVTAGKIARVEIRLHGAHGHHGLQLYALGTYRRREALLERQRDAARGSVNATLRERRGDRDGNKATNPQSPTGKK